MEGGPASGISKSETNIRWNIMRYIYIYVGVGVWTGPWGYATVIPLRALAFLTALRPEDTL